ncbi:MAG: hypothetical protein A2W19_04685 [Spirochaetes bacterium RBG_16_49_21]|nr:MAG: hypothetical protein A2W19_04685 [Spirochaetes bacterium RBG_16_49_21]
MRTKSGVLIVSILFCFIIFCGFGCKKAGNPIKIGHIHSISGAMSMYGKSCATGGEIAIEEINAAGGVLGRPLEQITRDDNLKPEIGLREAKNLVINDKVDFLTGTISSAVAQAISNYAKEEKKIFIVNIAQSSTLTEENFHRYIFRIDTNSIPYWGYAPALALAETWKNKKIISLGFDYVTGKDTLKAFKEKYLPLVPGAKIVGELWAPLNTTDFTAYITKMKNSKADAFFLACIYGGGELAFTKQAWAHGLYDKMKAIQSCAGDVETWSSVKKGEPYPKGAIATSRYPFWAIDDPKSKEFTKKHHDRLGYWPSYGAMNQYVIVYALKNAIEKVGAVDTEKIINALEGMELNTFVGTVKIRKCDHQAMMPTWYGYVDFTPELPFPIITRVKALGEDSYHSCEQIEKIRLAATPKQP